MRREVLSFYVTKIPYKTSSSTKEIYILVSRGFAVKEYKVRGSLFTALRTQRLGDIPNLVVLSFRFQGLGFRALGV